MRNNKSESGEVTVTIPRRFLVSLDNGEKPHIAEIQRAARCLFRQPDSTDLYLNYRLSVPIRDGQNVQNGNASSTRAGRS